VVTEQQAKPNHKLQSKYHTITITKNTTKRSLPNTPPRYWRESVFWVYFPTSLLGPQASTSLSTGVWAYLLPKNKTKNAIKKVITLLKFPLDYPFR